MSYIGSTPTTQSFIAGTDYFNGTGSQTAFTLSRSVVSVNDIEVVINNVEQQPNTAYTVSGTTITFTSAPSAGTANIYVRYLSTTTQSITPSQNTVSYNTLNSDNQSKLGISYKNRLINGAMVINQRAFSGTPNNEYTLDRWNYSNSATGKVTISQSSDAPAGFVNSLLVTSSSAYSATGSDFFGIQQRIEGYNIADLNFGSASAKTITISFWVKSSLTGTFSGAINNGAWDTSYAFTYVINAANTWEQKTVTIVGASSGTWLTTNGNGMRVWFSMGLGTTYATTANTWVSGSGSYGTAGSVNLVGANGATWYITGVQFEVGTQATTFDYRSIGTELALCQRYFEMNVSQGQKPADGVTTSDRYPFAAYGTGAGGLTISYKVEKRAGATITLYGGSNAFSSAGQLTYYNAGWQQTTSVTLGSISTTTNFNIDGQKAGTFTAANCYIAQPVWTASAEL